MKTVPLFLFLVSASALPAQAAPIDYDQQIRPFLKDNCIACHNKTTTKGGLNMETPELMAKGGDSDVGIIPGNGTESIMFQAAAHTWDSEMPPKGNKVGAVNLTPEQLALFKAWIDQGAKASPKKLQVIAWESLPTGLQSIYAIAVTPLPLAPIRSAFTTSPPKDSSPSSPTNPSSSPVSTSSPASPIAMSYNPSPSAQTALASPPAASAK